MLVGNKDVYLATILELCLAMLLAIKNLAESPSLTLTTLFKE